MTLNWHDFIWGFAPGVQQAFLGLGLLMGGLKLATGIGGLIGKRKGGPASAMSGTAVAAGQDVIHRSRDLDTFYKGYLQKGSPLLQERQRAGAENVAGEFQGARESAMQSLAGRGYAQGGSGTQAGLMGGMFAAQAKTGADTYLENLLANEKFKFAAAQGMQDTSKTETGLTGAIGQYPGQVPQPGEKLNSLVRGVGGLLGGLGGLFKGGNRYGGVAQQNVPMGRDPVTGLGPGMT